MLTTPEKIVFVLLILATAAAFLVPIVRRIRIVLAGSAEDRFRDLWARFRHAVVKVLCQRCTSRGERFFTGLMHVGIFYGALTFDTMTVSHTLEGFIDAPIDLLDEIEAVLKIQCAPMTWPIGMGKGFRGVYHLYDDSIAFFNPQADKGTAENINGLDNPRLDELIVNEIISARNEIALSLANHQMDVYQLLDDNQKKEWNKFSGEFGERRQKRIMKMMRDVDVNVD